MMKSIKQALIEDAAAILQLQKLAYQSEAKIYNDFSIPPLTQTLDELKDEFAQKFFLKAEFENTIVGSVRGYQACETCYIERLAVHPNFQRQGIGTKLMEQIELQFEQTKRFELFTGHRSNHNIILYQRLGYAVFKTKEITQNLAFVFMEKYK